MKLPINDSFVIQVANQANIDREEMRKRNLASAGAVLVPQEPVLIPLADVEAVLVALHVLGHYTPPLWRNAQ